MKSILQNVNNFKLIRVMLSLILISYSIKILQLPVDFTYRMQQVNVWEYIQFSIDTWHTLTILFLLASCLFMLGIYVRFAGLFLFLFILVFINNIPYVKEVHFPYIQFMILYYVLFYSDKLNIPQKFKILSIYYYSASYFYFGISKFFAVAWMNGQGMSAFFGLIQRTTGINFSSQYDIILVWGIPLIEVSAIFYLFFKKMRIPIHVVMIVMHMGIGLFTVLDYLSYAMIVFNYFIWHINLEQ